MRLSHRHNISQNNSYFKKFYGNCRSNYGGIVFCCWYPRVVVFAVLHDEKCWLPCAPIFQNWIANITQRHPWTIKLPHPLGQEHANFILFDQPIPIEFILEGVSVDGWNNGVSRRLCGDIFHPTRSLAQYHLFGLEGVGSLCGQLTFTMAYLVSHVGIFFIPHGLLGCTTYYVYLRFIDRRHAIPKSTTLTRFVQGCTITFFRWISLWRILFMCSTEKALTIWVP